MHRVIFFLLGAAALSACKPPLHLTYDFGRAYVDTLTVQADLTRPSVQYAGYSLYGPEAAMIRLNVMMESSDKEDSESELQAGGTGGGR